MDWRTPVAEALECGQDLIGPDLCRDARLAARAIDEPDEWRRRRLCDIEWVIERVGRTFQPEILFSTPAAMQRGWEAARGDLRRLSRAGWMPDRPGRRPPSVKRIAAYWIARGEPFAIDEGRPQCFRCRATAPEWVGSYFDRAHLVDRQVGGLDHEGNTALLRPPCHRMMPLFEIDEGMQAIDWILDGLESIEVAYRRQQRERLQVTWPIADTWPLRSDSV